MLRRLRTHTTKLLHAKTRRLRGEKSTLSKSLSLITLRDYLPLWFLSSFSINKSSRSLCSLSHASNNTMISYNSRAAKQSNLNPVSKEKISDSVELCETAVCFLHIQLIGTNKWLPRMHNVPPEVDCWIFKISCEVRVLKQSQSALFCSITKIAILLVLTCMMSIDCASLFTDQRISGLPIHAK